MSAIEKTHPMTDPFSPYYSTRLKKFLVLSFTIGSKLVTHPYYYDESSDTFRYRRDGKVWIWYFNFVLTMVHYGYLVARTVEASLDDNVTFASVVFLQFMVVYYGFSVMFQFSLLGAGNEVCALANGSLQFYLKQGLQEKYHRKEDKLREIKMAEFILGNLLVSMVNMIVSLTVYGIVAPETPFFISSLLTDPWSTSPLCIGVRILSVVMSVYEFYIFYTTGFLISCQVLSACFSLLPLMKHMRNSIEVRKLTSEDVRCLQEVRMLVESLNRCYGKFGFPITVTILVVLSSYGIYVLIKMSGFEQIVLGFLSVFLYAMLTVQFRALAGFYEESQALLEAWNRCGNQDIRVQKMLRSQRLLRVQLGNNFIDKGIVLTSTDMIINNSITLLLL